MLRLLKTFIIFYFTLLIFPQIILAQTSTPPPQPLRPFPKDPAQTKTFDSQDPFITQYCAQRPTAVQNQTFFKGDRYIKIKVSGTMTQDFQNFVTPLLSITDPKEPDIDLDYELKAQRYLTDYFDGRAYFEPYAENLNSPEFVDDLIDKMGSELTSTEISLIKSSENLEELPYYLQQKIQSGFTLSRFGVLRKLSSNITQDRYKRLIIKRATGGTNENELQEIYGFTPSSTKIKNYPLICWDGQKPTDFGDYPQCSKGDLISLSSFNSSNWPPLPEDSEFNSDYNLYWLAYKNWVLKDNGKWFDLWPYVPLVTRDDATGFILPINEPNQNTSPSLVKVFHPHLARTYELSALINFAISPETAQTIDYNLPPNLDSDQWQQAPWPKDTWWLDSGKNQSGWDNHGPLCDPLNPSISTTGDPAYDSTLTTAVNSHTETILNPQYEPRCNDLDDDERKKANCYFTHVVRYTPDYLLSYTPFLNQIINYLYTSPNAVFPKFMSLTELEANPPQNWLGIGRSSNNLTANFAFAPGNAEAGLLQSPEDPKHYYKYLGFIQCQKESLLERLHTGTDPYPWFGSICKPDQEYVSLINSGGPGTSDNCSENVPQPFSDELKALIQKAKNKYPDGAIHHVPEKVLMAIYYIEGLVAWSDPASYTCEKTTANDLGLMQINDNTIDFLAAANDLVKPDNGVCSDISGKLSRCNPLDALELASRVLLIKVGKWDFNAYKPLGNLETKNEVYNASYGYYGTLEPNQYTTKHIYMLNLHNKPVPADGQLSYAEFVCSMSDYCTSPSDFPSPRQVLPLP